MKEEKEMTKKEMLLLEAESVNVNVDALVLAVREYAGNVVIDQATAVAYIKSLAEDSYRNNYIQDFYKRYAVMTPELLAKWYDYRDGKCGEPIAANDGKPLNPCVGGINVNLGNAAFAIMEDGVRVFVGDDDDYVWLGQGDLQYLLRSVEVVKNMTKQLR